MPEEQDAAAVREADNRNRRLRRKIAERDGAICNDCGLVGTVDGEEPTLTLDHIRAGEGNDLANLQLLCRECNSAKGTRDPEDHHRPVRFASAVSARGFTVLPNIVLTDSALSLGARMLYAMLRHYAWQDARCWPGQESLAANMGVSGKTLRGQVAELIEAGLVRVKRRGRGLTNVYVLFEPTNGQESDGQNGKNSRSGPVKTPAEVRLKEEDSDKTGDTYLAAVEKAWLASAPPLIEHRPSYFADPKVRRKIADALGRYGADDVVAAVEAYAAVVASTEHFFDYRWTLGDFLARGLDRFVPEARPMDNFRSGRRKGPARLSVDEVIALGKRS